MKTDDLIAPISDDAPCGPDLFENGDADFEEYYFGALGRLPEFLQRPGVVRPDGSRTPDQLFDPTSLDIASEAREIDGLLGRSRDLRLLVLRAQWEMLAGRLQPMTEAVEGIAALLESHRDAVHPGLSDGISARREALGDLNQPVTMVQALQMAGLVGSTAVTLRKLKISAGSLTAQTAEEEQIQSGLADQLAFAPYLPKVTQAHGAMLRFLESLARIEAACRSHPERPFTPSFEQVRATALEIIDATCTACPELPRYDATPPAASTPVQDDQPAQTLAQVSVVASPASSKTVAVVSHAHARRLLEACEAYYRKNEPSSAAVLLVAQARELIGMPLIAAMQMLLPAQAQGARIDFGPPLGLQIGFDRLLALSSARSGVDQSDSIDDSPVSEIGTPQDAAATLLGVETYFRQHERSSPVPLLLQRARSYLDRDFQSLLEEFIPREPR